MKSIDFYLDRLSLIRKLYDFIQAGYLVAVGILIYSYYIDSFLLSFFANFLVIALYGFQKYLYKLQGSLINKLVQLTINELGQSRISPN